MNINSENHLLETKWSVNKNTNGTWTGHVNLGSQGSTSTFVYASDYLRTLSNIRKLRATATLYFVTREENVPFHRRTFSQAFRHPSSQRFHMAAMKGKGDPKKDLSVLKWTHSMAWLCFNNLVLSMEKNVHYIFIFQVSSTSGDWYYQSVFSPHCCANYLRHLRAGRQLTQGFGTCGILPLQRSASV